MPIVGCPLSFALPTIVGRRANDRIAEYLSCTLGFVSIQNLLKQSDMGMSHLATIFGAS